MWVNVGAPSSLSQSAPVNVFVGDYVKMNIEGWHSVPALVTEVYQVQPSGKLFDLMLCDGTPLLHATGDMFKHIWSTRSPDQPDPFLYLGAPVTCKWNSLAKWCVSTTTVYYP